MLKIMYEDSDGGPTGSKTSRFVFEIGCSVRIFVPLQKIFWKDVTEFEKSPIYDKVKKEMVDIQTTQRAHVVGEESESQGVQLIANDIAAQVLGTTSCYYRGLGKGPKIPRATSRADMTQRENAKLRQVVHNLQSQNEHVLVEFLLLLIPHHHHHELIKSHIMIISLKLFYSIYMVLYFMVNTPLLHMLLFWIKLVFSYFGI
ncbi:uncharacterized protein LOC111397694 [Olea europaea var. sylvestris]|nr:uncharacterized protein LOC111397694 [Olea europaea var. sylvestris]CAA2967201.1 Hypothetical predicted protein [Olea europaea subsp. europaea]